MRELSPSLFLGSLALGLAASRLPAVVISEIHYHPPAGEENLEFIEVSNDTTTPDDISGYRFLEGIEFEFPPGTILPASGILVVCADVEAVKARYGIQNALGNFIGKLDNSGEKITLANHCGIVLQSLRYRDDGKWPVAPDGTGHALALKNVHLDPKEPESWAQSRELGGSPGLPNFPAGEELHDDVIIDRGETWRYAKGLGPFSEPEAAWREPLFDDSAWLEGPSGFGFADNDDNTVLEDMLGAYTSVACRKPFNVSRDQLEGKGELTLAIDFDDGFCAFVNGKEAARGNCGAPGTEVTWNGVATARKEPGEEAFFRIPASILQEGQNVLAIVGYNFRIADNDFSLIPRLLYRTRVEATRRFRVKFNEVYRGSPGQGWVELFNSGTEPVDLSGYIVTDDSARQDPYRFPPGTSIAPRGFLVVAQAATRLDLSVPRVKLFLTGTDGLTVAASAFSRAPSKRSPPGPYAEALWPDGGEESWLTRTPTPGAPNQVERVSDVVINEILYHPPEDRPGEFIELLNRGGKRMDLSGFQFTKGIDFTLPEGTVLEPGGYLVVAEDPDFIREHYQVEALGPYNGHLSDDGETIRLADNLGNLAAEVRYFDGGTWPTWTDGGGSSLELIDPSQDPSFAASWDASDESSKAPWELLSFKVESYAPARVSELHMFLAERGACRVDDVSISRDAGANLIPNPGFETSTKPWVMEGTHIHSRRVDTDSFSGSACLEIAASGKGDTLVNRIETDTQPVMSQGPYDVSLRARWLRGGSLLLVHGEYSAGPYGGRPSPAINLSGNTLSAGLRLTVPWNLGTPGKENSARRKLLDTHGTGDLGPVVDRVQHSPPSPSADEPVVVKARVSDSGGVASVQVFYRMGSAAGDFNPVPLHDDGQHGDGEAGDGIFAGEIPGVPARTKVVFYVEAQDSQGNAGHFPREAPQRTCLYMAQGPEKEKLDAVRVVLDQTRTTELQSRRLHSNDLLDGTLIFDDAEVYYDVGVRYRGSPWGRPARTSYRVRFPDDQKFHRGRKAVNLSARGQAPNEGMVYFFTGRMGVPEKPAPGAEYYYIRTAFNGGAFTTQGLFQAVDRDYLTKWYGDAAQGPALKVEGRKQLNDAEDLAGMWDGASFTYKKEDKENYRGYFIPSIRRSDDDWSALIALAKVMDRKETPDDRFDQEIEKVLDLEEFLRVLTVRIVTSDWDAFGVGNGHNGYLVLDPNDGRWDLLPFDVDNTFSNASASLFPSADPDVARLMRQPGPRRLYFRILEDYTAGYWSPVTAKPFLDAVQAATGVPTASIRTYLGTNGNLIKRAIMSATTVPFRLITGEGGDVEVHGETVELAGEAPVKVVSLSYETNVGKGVAFEPAWASPTQWKAVFPLKEPKTVFQLTGADRQGAVVGSATVAVVTTAFGQVFRRGDVDNNRVINITDPIDILRYLIGGAPLSCLDAADFNDDGKVDITDAVSSLDFLFREGSPPPAPYPNLGTDPTDDGIGC